MDGYYVLASHTSNIRPRFMASEGGHLKKKILRKFPKIKKKVSQKNSQNNFFLKIKKKVSYGDSELSFFFKTFFFYF